MNFFHVTLIPNQDVPLNHLQLFLAQHTVSINWEIGHDNAMYSGHFQFIAIDQPPENGQFLSLFQLIISLN